MIKRIKYKAKIIIYCKNIKSYNFCSVIITNKSHITRINLTTHYYSPYYNILGKKCNFKNPKELLINALIKLKVI